MGIRQSQTIGATVVLMGTPSFEKTAATAVVKIPRLLKSISTCGNVPAQDLSNMAKLQVSQSLAVVYISTRIDT